MKKKTRNFFIISTMMIVLALGIKSIIIKKHVLEGQDFFELISNQLNVQLVEQTEKQLQEAINHTYKWQVSHEGQAIGLLTLDDYTLKNEDYYYYLYYEPRVESDVELNLALPIAFKDSQYRQVIYHDTINYETSTWSEPTQFKQGDKLPKNTVVMNSERNDYLLSYINVFKKESKGVKKEVYNLAQELQGERGKFKLSFPHYKNTTVEQWGMIAKGQLIDWSNGDHMNVLKRMDLNRARKWGIDGAYYKTPNSYFPSSETSFWRNPAHHIGNKFLSMDNGRFFKDFSLISLYIAVNTQNEEGIWYSEPRSNWLYNDYGIDGPFYDTRFNTDAALFLLRGYNAFKEQVLLDAAIKYGEFLLTYGEKYHYKTENNGYLIWDYRGSDDVVRPNHVSLNHLITEMNFLYELYKTTGDTRYYRMGQKIKIAVQDTKGQWENPNNGDLWYAYLKDGSYGLKDYPLLTLNDLRYSQNLFKEVDGHREGAFDDLIKIKEDYLLKAGLPLK